VTGFTRLLAASATALVVACAAPRSGTLEPVSGLGTIETVPGGWQVEVPGGIGRFHVHLPAGGDAEVVLRYDASRPFTRLEGIQAVEPGADVVPGMSSDGVNRVWFTAGDTALDLTVIVIDYYR
jgi:hypothetical protein